MNESKSLQQRELARDLTRYLADTYVLFNSTQNCHWNVESPRFRSQHVLFEEQYRELFEAIDMLAERVRILGFYIPARLDQLVEYATLKQPLEPVQDDVQMIGHLIDGHRHLIDASRKLIRRASELEDEATADALTERLRAHEKAEWILRSHTDEGSRRLTLDMVAVSELAHA